MVMLDRNKSFGLHAIPPVRRCDGLLISRNLGQAIFYGRTGGTCLGVLLRSSRLRHPRKGTQLEWRDKLFVSREVVKDEDVNNLDRDGVSCMDKHSSICLV